MDFVSDHVTERPTGTARLRQGGSIRGVVSANGSGQASPRCRPGFRAAGRNLQENQGETRPPGIPFMWRNDITRRKRPHSAFALTVPSVFIRLNRSIARSRRRNGWWEFSTLLLAQRPTSCRSAMLSAFTAAPYERRPSVVTTLAQPCRFISFLHELDCSGLVPLFGHEAFQHFALVVDGPPEVAHLALDADIDPVQAPAPLGVLAHPPHP